MIGQKLGPYEILEIIGRGGMATVYRGYQENVDRFVAIKVIQKGISLDPTAMDRFTREARLVARLEHPHILPVYDFNGRHDPPYIVMRYLPAGTLKEIMEKGQLPIGEVVHLFRQIGSALDYAHRQGVVHRDIKPSNIMVDGEGNAFLTDFGIARMVEGDSGLTASGMALGTPGYMAPEQGMGAEVDGRVDIYALGVIMYEMLAGKAPFTAETPMAVILKHINDPVPSIIEDNPELPPELEAVMLQALAKNPDERYQTAGELAQALSEAAGPDINTRPVRLREIASQTIEELENAREELAKTSAETAIEAPVLDEATVQERRDGERTVVDKPTGEPEATRMAEVDQRGGGIPRTPVIIGVIVLILIIGGAVLLFLNNQQQNTNATETAEAEIAQETEISQQTIVAINSTSTSEFGTRQAADAETATADAENATIMADDNNTATAESRQTEAAATVTADAAANETATATALTPPPTDTPVPTDTFTPTATYTSTDTPTSTETPTSTDTPTSTPTDTATETPTSTDTPTSTPTSTPTFTETPEPSATPSTTPSPIPSPTPLPPGQMPFVEDFEQDDSLVGWAYDPANWQLRNEGGNTALYGSSGFNTSLQILGQEVPEWNEEGVTDIVLRYRINLTQSGSGGRIIFRYSPSGYYVLEMAAGLFRLRRGDTPDINRAAERNLPGGNYSQISTQQWYDVVAWVEGGRIFVYLNSELIMKVNDTGIPLPAGAIHLQTFSASLNPVAYDDIIVQRAEPASDHFDNASTFPDTWARDPVANVGLESGSGNQYVAMNGPARLVPLTSQLDDFLMACDLRSAEGDFVFRVRDSSQGHILFEGDAGNLIVSQIDADGTVVNTERLSQFYSRDFNVIIIELVGNRLLVYDRAGRTQLDQIWDNMPPRGAIVFETSQDNDRFYVDDCLFAQTAASSTADAQFALDIITFLNNPARRPFRELLTDWQDDFSDRFRTDEFWESDPGTYERDSGAQEHSAYYSIETTDQQVFRRIRREIDSTRNVFGDGTNRDTFRDSTDIYIKVDVRIPEDAPAGSTAIVGARSTLNSTRTGFDQYQVELVKEDDGRIRVKVRPFLQADKAYVYDELLPETLTGDWIEIIVITEDDRIAFFADGRFLTTIRPTSILGGTLTIGAGPNSLVHFDDLVIRDTSVNE